MELWEDTSAGVRHLPPAQRHYVRVLFNGAEVAVPPATRAAGEALTLERFHEEIISKRGLTEEQRAERCVAGTSWWGFMSERWAGKEKVDSSKY